jgi:hypothetical protein
MSPILKREIFVLAEVGEGGYIGLCSTCSNATTCKYRKKRGFDAIYCEIYVGDTVSSESDPVEPDESASPSHASREYKGLCMNCANRETCILPKPATGVWHCEEYL